MSYRIRRFIRLSARVASIAMLTLLIAGTVGLTILHARGVRVLSVQSASMVPVFHLGDAVVVQPVTLSNLRPGDIVSYRSVAGHNVTISHRLVGIDRRTGLMVTQGDALQGTDPPISPQQLIGRDTAVAPRFGLVLDAIRHPLGLAVVVYLPATLIIFFETRLWVRHYRRPLYLLDYRHGSKG